MVPKNATAAVMVHVRHKSYPVTDAGSAFTALGKITFTGWKVVSDDTAPGTRRVQKVTQAVPLEQQYTH